MTPTDFVLFDGELEPNPADVVGFVPRDRLRDIRAESRSTASVNDHRLFLEYAGVEESHVAEFRFAAAGSLLSAWGGWYRHALTGS